MCFGGQSWDLAVSVGVRGLQVHERDIVPTAVTYLVVVALVASALGGPGSLVRPLQLLYILVTPEALERHWGKAPYSGSSTEKVFLHSPRSS